MIVKKCLDRSTLCLDMKQIECSSQMNYILQETSQPSAGEEKIASLTAGERTAWANARSEFFFKGTNRTSLDAIEKSAFVVVLDDVPYEFDEASCNIPNFVLFYTHGFKHIFVYSLLRTKKCTER